MEIAGLGSPMRPSFFHHLHPPTIPTQQSRWRYTLGAGGLSVYLSLTLLITGVLLMFYYIPTPQEAGTSIQTITYLVPFGGVLRNLHYWAAQLLLIVIVIHMLRVILTGAYTAPRRFNYLIGLFLLVICIFLDFSGYILRWDEGIRWALVAGTNLVKTIPGMGNGLYAWVMGGSQPGPATLTRFYAWHIMGLTLLLVIFGVWHIFRVRRDGGIAVPPPALRSDQSRIPRNTLVRREGLATLISSSILMAISILFPAPIAPPIASINQPPPSYIDTRAPWFFLWVQQLLKFGDPFWLGVMLPFLFLMLLVALPFAFPLAQPHELGRWLPPGNRLAQFIVVILSVFILGLILAALFTPVQV
jgi:quinol-cytochrome oxidoreductase complex cytochrome b subunit